MKNFKWIRKYFLELCMLTVVLIWSSNNAVMKIVLSKSVLLHTMQCALPLPVFSAGYGSIEHIPIEKCPGRI